MGNLVKVYLIPNLLNSFPSVIPGAALNSQNKLYIETQHSLLVITHNGHTH